jgi:hypothetical protein
MENSNKSNNNNNVKNNKVNNNQGQSKFKNQNNNNNNRNRTKSRRFNRSNRYNNNNNNRLNNFNRQIRNVIRIQNPKTINMNIERNDKNMVITGKDLILNQDNQINPNGLYAVIPVNPAYWDNTRIKNLATLNQYYIPINIKLEYVPLVSKFQKGNITIGTISNSTMTENNIQSTLISSVSGITYSCSNSFVREIQVKSLIPQRKLLINSKLDKESVPFYICIYFKDIKENEQDIIPGQFYISYMFKFFNPITVPNTFKTTQNIQLSQFENNYFNISCILTQENNNFKVGTILDVEYKDSQYRFLLNNTEVNIENDKLATFYYSDKYETNTVPPQPEPAITNYSLNDYNQSQSTTVVLDSENNILVVIPYLFNHIKVYMMRAGASSMYSINIENSYYKLFKSTSITTNLPNPLNILYTQVLEMNPQTSYTTLLLSTEFVKFIDVNIHNNNKSTIINHNNKKKVLQQSKSEKQITQENQIFEYKNDDF